MPLPSEHTARQMAPGKCDSIRRDNNKFGPGIDVQWCVKGGKAEVQSIHFDAAKFTAQEAKDWLKKHQFSAAEFEAATGGKTKAEAVPPPAVREVDLAAERLPCELRTSTAPLEVQAASGDGNARKRMVSATAYTGASMRLPGFAHPVVIDLTGMKVPAQRFPLLRQHDAERIVGFTDGSEITAQRLRFTGSLTGATEAGREALALADEGFPWQVSVGADVVGGKMEFIDKDASATVNGRKMPGPLYVARATALRECSLVPMGADPGTSATVGGEAEPDLQAGAGLSHDSKTQDNEPDWGSVDKTKLPRVAFADHGEADKKSTWGYPHHDVTGGTVGPDGVYTSGTLWLNRGGLNAAWSAAQGGRSGQKASQEVIDHLQAHRRALGLDKGDK